MKLPDWLPFGSNKPAVSGRISASSSNPDNPAERSSWRRFGAASARNLPAHDHRMMVEQCDRSAKVDGMSRAHMRLVRSITVGAQEVGPEVRCKDVAARDALQRFADLVWNLPGNDFACSLGDFMDGLCASGTVALTVRTDRDAAGVGSQLTSFGAIDPAVIVDLVIDPGNAREPLAVLRQSFDTSATLAANPCIRSDGSVHPMFRGADGNPLPVGTSKVIPRNKQLGGDVQCVIAEPCMLVGVNRTGPTMTLGTSDLMPSLDLQGLIDDLVFGATERTVNFGAYSIVVKFPKGTSKADIDEKMKLIQADLESGRGRAVGVTEDISIEAVSAQLNAGEIATVEKFARTHALIALGPWGTYLFSDGGATNVATAAEQGSPVANFLLERQNILRRYVVRCMRYALEQIPEARRLLAANEDAHIHLSLPVIVAKDTTRESNVLMVETNVLTTAMDANLVKLEAAQREFRDGANRYGLHFKPEDSPTEEEIAKKREEQANALQMPALSLPPDGPTPPASKPTEGTPKAAAA